MSIFHFRRFQTRIMVLFLGLFALVQLIAFSFIYAAQLASAQAQINAAFEVGAGVFNKLIEERSTRLIQQARLLSSDYAFKVAYATEETETILSALQNHQMRINADIMILVSLEARVMAYTLDPAGHGRPFDHPRLLEAAENSPNGTAAGIVFIGDRAHQMIIVPLMVPQPDAWIVIGFLLDDRFAAEIQKLTLSHVSLLHEQNQGSWSVVASTLPADRRAPIADHLASGKWEERKSTALPLGGNDYVSLVIVLDKTPGRRVTAVLLRSLDEALIPVMRLLWALAGLTAVGLAVSIGVGTMIARSVTRPVRVLAENAGRVAQGDYGQEAAITQKDEIGELATSFNHMVRGLAEKEKIRDLLGKVVSPAIAQRLLSKKIELGGEDVEVTVLFSDVRNFTAMCEDRAPAEILALINSYLTRISAVIEENNGVVDKYIGDAVMALFGAPLAHDDDPLHAVRTAIGMRRALAEFNLELAGKDLPPLDIGVGINTATVVAGNIGSPSRLNYTVIGDGVNLASRLEGLTKRYDVPIIVSETTKNAIPGFVFRELDRVMVKGKTRPVTIYEPLGESGALDPETLHELAGYQAALGSYRAGDLARARGAFVELSARHPERRLYEIYLSYIEHAAREPLDRGEAGAFVLSD